MGHPPHLEVHAGVRAAELPLRRRHLPDPGPFQADAALFRSGWFVESLATQTLVVFAIRTRGVPFIRNRPSLPLAASVVGVVVVAAYLPVSFLAWRLGFVAPPASLYICITAVTVVYLSLVDAIKGVAFAFDRTGDHP